MSRKHFFHADALVSGTKILSTSQGNVLTELSPATQPTYTPSGGANTNPVMTQSVLSAATQPIPSMSTTQQNTQSILSAATQPVSSNSGNNTANQLPSQSVLSTAKQPITDTPITPPTSMTTTNTVLAVPVPVATNSLPPISGGGGGGGGMMPTKAVTNTATRPNFIKKNWFPIILVIVASAIIIKKPLN